MLQVRNIPGESMIGDYGPSHMDQGVGPEDIEEPKPPFAARIDLRLWVEFISGDRNDRYDDGEKWAGLRKRITIEDFKEFEKDLDVVIRKWSGDPYLHLWVLKYFVLWVKA
jgi:hypothetical protein